MPLRLGVSSRRCINAYEQTVCCHATANEWRRELRARPYETEIERHLEAGEAYANLQHIPSDLQWRIVRERNASAHCVPVYRGNSDLPAAPDSYSNLTASISVS